MVESCGEAENGSQPIQSFGSVDNLFFRNSSELDNFVNQELAKDPTQILIKMVKVPVLMRSGQREHLFSVDMVGFTTCCVCNQRFEIAYDTKFKPSKDHVIPFFSLLRNWDEWIPFWREEDVLRDTFKSLESDKQVETKFCSHLTHLCKDCIGTALDPEKTKMCNLCV